MDYRHIPSRDNNIKRRSRFGYRLIVVVYFGSENRDSPITVNVSREGREDEAMVLVVERFSLKRIMIKHATTTRLGHFVLSASCFSNS